MRTRRISKLRGRRNLPIPLCLYCDMLYLCWSSVGLCQLRSGHGNPRMSSTSPSVLPTARGVECKAARIRRAKISIPSHTMRTRRWQQGCLVQYRSLSSLTGEVGAVVKGKISGVLRSRSTWTVEGVGLLDNDRLVFKSYGW